MHTTYATAALMTQDMATIQRHCITSPTPAATLQQDSSGDPISDSDLDSEVPHETSRTDSEMSTSTGRSSTPDQTTESPKTPTSEHIQSDVKLNNNNNNKTDDEPKLKVKIMKKYEEEILNLKTDHSEKRNEMKDTKTEKENIHEDNENGREADTKYVCPICESALASQHEFTLHIRSHNNNNNNSDDNEASEPIDATFSSKGFSCKICSKVLSSSSSLDRHVLVHSGERPFKCRLCGVAFTTNGNMHRHMRTHGAALKAGSGEPYDSDGSTDSGGSYANRNGKSPGSERGENDNAKRRRVDREEDESPETEAGTKRKGDDVEVDGKKRRSAAEHKNGTVVGFRDLTFTDFSSEKFPHIARAACERKLHQASSAYHRFQCDTCGRAFPCNSALAIHRRSCSSLAPTDLSADRERRDQSGDDEETDKKREDFFANLDLQNKSLPTSPTAGDRRETDFEHAAYFEPDGRRDLADIQSIISVSHAGGLRLQDLAKSPATNGSITPSDRSFSDAHEEEQQDCFAAEFRRMKLKGEFPCRLCTAVFPNLRALKGHNRAHLTGSDVFRCNMCAYSSVDKAVLVRHMRSHNGDRPYECALCNYAFTTKANCERHLRNRHSKLTRDEVKESIVYHPSEDPTNDADFHPKAATGEARRALTFDPSPDDPADSRDKYQSKADKAVPKFERGLAFEPSPDDLSNSRDRYQSRVDKTALRADLDVTHEVATMTSSKFDDSNSENSRDSYENDKYSSNEEDLVIHAKNNNNNNEHMPFKLMEHQRINSKVLYGQTNGSYARNVNSPLDLSMDALDLSKKPAPAVALDEHSEPQDLSKKCPEYNNNNNNNIVVGKMSRSLSPERTPPKVDLNVANFYASNPHLMYLNNNGFPFPTQNPFSHLGPYFVASAAEHPLNLLQNANSFHEFTAELRERILKESLMRAGLQMSGGTLLDPVAVATAAGKLQQLQAMAEMAARNKEASKGCEERVAVKEEVPPPVKPRDIPNNNNNNNNNVGASSVKMVIKNGVLMPKQKQRRYRTERPYVCDHCSARFTLRSNMERHVKQQHPDFWTQRQRGSSSVGVGAPRGRTNNHSNLSNDSNSQTFVEKSAGASPIQMPGASIAKSLASFRVDGRRLGDAQEPEQKPFSVVNNNNNKTFISDEVRHAIAQQLKSKLDNYPGSANDTRAEADEEDGLVIDEEDADDAEETRTEVEANAPMNLKVLNRELMKRPEGSGEAFKPSFKDQVKVKEESADLVSVKRLLDNATTQTHAFQRYFRGGQDNEEEVHPDEGSEEDEEGLVAPSDNSGSDENRSDPESSSVPKKKSAYSLAPNRVSCPYCHRKFPWSSSLRRHVLTHTGQKPYKCAHCPLLFTTKSNCDRHLLRKHGNANAAPPAPCAPSLPADSPANAAQPSYTMRNVPERPFKCNHCPSSTFSTLSNLKKHVASKHHAEGGGGGGGGDESHPESDEDQAAGPDDETPAAPVAAPSGNPNVDLPFKCHLCEGSYGDRQEALDHIKESHPSEFELLVSKGALENGNEDNNNVNGHDEGTPGGEESLEQLRGKFPDYTNRKVMCAFCMRRFWSAEDLRRHMRTHTGERPFSCDICRRRFTLKHSMLRHRKKHSANDASTASGDDEVNHPHDKILKSYIDAKNNERSQGNRYKSVNHNNNNNNNNNNGYPDNRKHVGKLTTNINNNEMETSRFDAWSRGPDKYHEEKREGDEETDLIGNLLGIRDRSIIDKMLLSKSADDAAKLLGVGSRE